MSIANIGKVCVGNTNIIKIFMGNTLIFSNTGSGSSGDNNTDTVIGSTYLTLGNKIVGYVPDITGTTSDNTIIVSTASALSSAISNAKAGTTIYVKGGTYTINSGLTISKSGSSGNPIVIKNYPGETPILTCTQVSIASGTKYVTFEGFKIQDLTQLDWDTCLSVGSGCSYITLRNLEITNIKSVTADNGCNPLVLYGDGSTPISNCLIENCYVHDCHTGRSEAITLNGNVTDCIVRNCCINNTMNIGIDLAGNFSWTGTVGDANNQARNIIVENNLVMNCQSPYATSAGLYCDGGRDNTFRYNVVYNCQCGIELGAEESGATVQNFHVYGNLIIDSGRSIGVGGYQSTSATHQNTWIYNNTIICGTSNKENYGLYLERTKNLYFVNNIVYGASGTTLYSSGSGSNVTLSGNCWYNGTKPSADSTGITSNPLFINNNGSWTGNYNLKSTSPCINKGQTVSDTTLCGTTDINGNARVNNMIDIGAFEYYDGSSSGGEITPIYGNIVVSTTSLSFTSGNSSSFTVKLDQSPTNSQTISISASGCNVDKTSLTFTSSNYSIAQTVTVSGNTVGTGSIVLRSSNVSSKTIDISITSSGSSGGGTTDDEYSYTIPSILSSAKHVGSGQTYSTIQSAINDLGSNGGQVVVHAGTYTEKIVFNNSGTTSNHIIIMPNTGDTVIVSGGTESNKEVCVFDLNGKSNIDIVGLEIANTNCGAGSSACAYGILGRGGEKNINIAHNIIHDIKTTGNGDGKGEANAILMYGESTTSIANVLVYNNHIYNMTTNWSESVSIAGNCENVYLINNTLHDLTNIAMDFYGNAGYCTTASLDQPRNCIMRGNLVYNLSCPYDGASAYYCDGAHDCIIERNIAHNCACGIEIGAEEPCSGTVGNIIVRNNLIYDCEGYEPCTVKLGGYQSTSPSVTNVKFLNNTLVTKKSGVSLFAWMKSDNIQFKNNIFYVGSNAGEFVDYEDYTPQSVTWSNNIYYYKGQSNSNFSMTFGGSERNWSTWTSSYDKTGIFATSDPFDSNYKLTSNSIAKDSGATLSTSDIGELDLAGYKRVQDGTIDIGAYEYGTESSGGGNTGGGESGGDTGGSTSTNVLPLFSEWQQETGLSVSSISDHDIVFTAPSAWTGIYLYGTTIISNGDTITVGCSNISSNAEFAIADASSNVIATINSTQLTQTVTVNGTSPFDIWITSSDTNQVTVVGAYIYIN